MDEKTDNSRGALFNWLVAHYPAFGALQVTASWNVLNELSAQIRADDSWSCLKDWLAAKVPAPTGTKPIAVGRVELAIARELADGLPEQGRGLTRADCGRIFEGAAVRTGDELALAVCDWALGFGWPLAEPQVLDEAARLLDSVTGPSGHWFSETDDAPEGFGEDIHDLANAAVDWLNQSRVADGLELTWGDGLDLVEIDGEDGWEPPPDNATPAGVFTR
jgi:hypothetical protein